MPEETEMVGLFWVIEDGGKSVVIALVVPLEQADPYGDMLTVDRGHLEHWVLLARRGACALREAGLPTAPAWSEYVEWPRGRVVYDCIGRHFVVWADRQLHQPAFVRLIGGRFCTGIAKVTILTDDHYQSVRRVLLPRAK